MQRLYRANFKGVVETCRWHVSGTPKQEGRGRGINEAGGR